MKRALIVAIFLTLAMSAFAAEDASARHVIKAYFNGQEATVTGVKLKVGEPFTVDLYVTPDRYTTVAALLREPGGGDDAYGLLSGDPKGTVMRKNGGPNRAVHFSWELCPTEAWVGGTAPLNIQYDVWGETYKEDVQGYFTVVEAYILPEHYNTPKQAGSDILPMACLLMALLAFRIKK